MVRARPRAACDHAGVPLFWRVYLAAAAVLVLGAVALVLLPVTVSERTLPAEIAVLAGGLALLLGVTVLLVRRSLAPLDRLVALARGVDLLRPGQRLAPGPGGDVREVAEVVDAFNGMLDRLEAERADSARRTLTAQEEERMRIARELHDEVGGTLTAVLLQLSRAAETAPPDISGHLHAAQDAARAGLEDVRRVVASLRPEALADLGLTSALAALASSSASARGWSGARSWRCAWAWRRGRAGSPGARWRASAGSPASASRSPCS